MGKKRRPWEPGDHQRFPRRSPRPVWLRSARAEEDYQKCLQAQLDRYQQGLHVSREGVQALRDNGLI